jgi:hypothetical protein
VLVPASKRREIGGSVGSVRALASVYVLRRCS